MVVALSTRTDVVIGGIGANGLNSNTFFGECQRSAHGGVVPKSIADTARSCSAVEGNQVGDVKADRQSRDRAESAVGNDGVGIVAGVNVTYLLACAVEVNCAAVHQNLAGYAVVWGGISQGAAGEHNHLMASERVVGSGV